MKIRPAFKTHGGKNYLADWLVEHFPDNYTNYNYIEPYAGGANVLLHKNPPVAGKIEVLGDTNLGSIQIFRAIRDECKVFVSKLKKIEYCEASFEKEKNKKSFDDYMEQAINEFVLRRMSRGGLKEKFAWSERLRGGEPGDVHGWKTILDVIPTISKRLERVYLFNKKAVEVIDAFDSSDTIIYVDPPYVEDTRVSKKAYGQHEMSIDDHIEMANLLLRSKCKVILSGYSCTLYNRLFKEWRKVSKKVPNHASQQKEKKIKLETCWMNY